MKGFNRFKLEHYKNEKNNIPVAPSNPNEAMRFDNKTDEDIVYNNLKYKTTRPIKDLIRNDKSSPHAKRKLKKGKTPRRLNKWIIYRRDKNASPEYKGKQAKIVSKEICEAWFQEPQEVKEFYAAIARLAEKNHIDTYGEDYKYQPGPYKKPNNQNKDKKEKESPSKLKTQATSVATPTPMMQQPQPQQYQQYPTPETLNSSPVSSPEELLPGEPMQSFAPLFAIEPALNFAEISPAELQQQQQYLQTPATTDSYSPATTDSYSPATSSSEEPALNFAESTMFPSISNKVPESKELAQQLYNLLVQENNSYLLKTLLQQQELWQNFSEQDLDNMNIPIYNNDTDWTMYDQNGSSEEALDNVDTTEYNDNFGLQLNQIGSSEEVLDNVETTEYNDNFDLQLNNQSEEDLNNLDTNKYIDNLDWSFFVDQAYIPQNNDIVFEQQQQQQQQYDDSQLYQMDFNGVLYNNDIDYINFGSELYKKSK